MKKSIIAAGAASVALAAMPIMGVFATTNTDVIDNITANVADGCTITRDGTAATPTDPEGNYARNVSVSVIAGQTGTQSSNTVNVTCSASGWNVTAKATTTDATSLVDNAVSDKGTPIAAGISGSSSYWAYKVDYQFGSDAAVSGSYAAIGNGAVAVPAATANTGNFTPGYKVFAQADQKAGYYEGSVTYTINMPAVNPGA